jgi:hypothetical protein
MCDEATVNIDAGIELRAGGAACFCNWNPRGVVMEWRDHEQGTHGAHRPAAQKYVPRLLEHAARGELDPSCLATHRIVITL